MQVAMIEKRLTAAPHGGHRAHWALLQDQGHRAHGALLQDQGHRAHGALLQGQGRAYVPSGDKGRSCGWMVKRWPA